MAIGSRNKSVPFSIIGASGYDSILSTRPFYMKSDISSNELPLYMKQTPDRSGTLKAETNWDLSLASNSRINHYSNGDMEYTQRDYSSNKYDSYYNTNRGNEAIEYTLSHDWSITDIAVEKDVMAISTKGWGSFEKYITPSEAEIYAAYMSQLTYYDIPLPTAEIVNVYTYNVIWDTIAGCSLTANGTLVLSYVDAYGNTQQISTFIADGESGPPIGPITSINAIPPTVVSWTGLPSTWPDSSCVYVDTYAPSTVTIEHPFVLPNDAVVVGNKYFRTSEINPKLTNFLIPDIIDLFEDPDKVWMRFQNNVYQADFEVPDYSDIYLKVIYTSAVGSQDRYLYGVTSLANEEKLYTFGGFIKFDDFFDGLLDRAILSDKTSIDTDDKFLWYIIIKDDLTNAGRYYSVGLSNYITFDFDYELSNKFYYEKDLGSTVYRYATVDLRTISTKSIEIIKIAGFPNCGKVDLYFPKTGNIDSFTDSTNKITSNNHGLSTGDRIKITEGLGNGNTINGLKYVSVIGPNEFSIYYDDVLSQPAIIYNVSKSSGIRWSAVDGNTWGYNLTLYSPTGKNGYATTLSLNTSTESPSGETPYDRAIETNGSEKPQSSLTGVRSWNNYYPYERFDSADNTIFGVINGNKFGSDISIKKYGDNYILMVAEEGASESFQLLSSFVTNIGEAIPKNKRVIPSFFPYGRVHFYTINPSARSIEYLTTYSPSDNPWAAYEIVNRQERILSQLPLYDNKSLQISDINYYNNTINDYWNGARFTQWSKDYIYNSTFDFNLPNQNGNQYDYGFVDRIKSADFEISNGKIYCVFIPNVKNGDFINYLRLKNIDRYIKLISFDVASPSSKLSSLTTINNSTYTNVDIDIQKQEISKFGNRIYIINGRVITGWSSNYRSTEYIYNYSRNINNLTLLSTIESDGNRGFGNYFVVEDTVLITNKYNFSDENGNPTTNPLQSLEIYRYDIIGNKYYYVDSITPTINLSNPIYNNVNSDTYEHTTNISYDNTSANSATYIINLDSKYDIKNDTLVLRDWNEYIGFHFDYMLNKFINKFHKFSTKSSQDSVLKLSDGSQAAFFDTSIEYDTGDYHKSLQIFDAVQIDENTLNNYVITIDTNYPNYLPLFLKTIDGYSSGNINFYTAGNAPSSTGIPLYLQPPMPLSTGIDLFIKQIDIANTGLSLFHKSTSISTTGVDLFIRNGYATGGLPLVFNSTEKMYFPLFLSNIINTTLSDNNLNFYIYNSYNATYPTPSAYNEYGDLLNNPVVPTNYFVMPLHISTIEYDDHGAGFNLYLDSPGGPSNGSMSLYQNAGGVSGQVFNNLQLSMNCSGYKGFENSNGANLFIRCPITTQVPLFVYNTVNTGNIPIYMSGANITATGINLYCSGVHYPNSTVTLMIDGDL